MENLPAIFGKYTLLRHLATGGMAELYLAIQRSISGFEKLIVIKKILSRYAADDEFIKMLLDEARIAATLNHPNIVQIYDVGSVGADYFIAMEFIHGEDLKNIVGAMRGKQMTSFPLEHALGIVMGLCKGLGYAHEHRSIGGEPLNIVHRDISPQNILVTYAGEVKIVDFGIARAAAREARAQDKEGGTLRGKFPYMSPEQIRGFTLDKRSDVFSAGIVLFELTTGRRLFKGRTELETLRMIVEMDYPRPSSLVPGYPPDLEEIVFRALRRDRDLRYANALEMLRDLEDFTRNHRIGVSTVALGRFMESLFSEKLHAEREALKEGKKLADVIREQEESGFSMDDFLDLTALPSSSTTSKAMTMTSAAPGAGAGARAGGAKKKRGAVTALVTALVVLLVLGGAGLGGLRYWQSTVLRQAGRIKVVTEPPGASVYVDGEKQPGETPLVVEKLRLDVQYGVKVKMEGFEAEKQRVAPTVTQTTVEVHFALVPVKPVGLGVLAIGTNRPDAVIFVDGTRQEARGSATVGGLAPEVPHTLFVQAAEAVDVTQEVTLKPGEVREVKLELAARPIGPDEFVLVVATDPPGATVTAGGVRLDGVTPGRWRLPLAKALTLVIEKALYVARTLPLKPQGGAELAVEETLAPKKAGGPGPGKQPQESAVPAGGTGTLYLASDPWANVTIAGVGSFQTPIANLSVPAGTLKITLENPPSGAKKTITVKIEPGETVRKKVVLK